MHSAASELLYQRNAFLHDPMIGFLDQATDALCTSLEMLPVHITDARASSGDSFDDQDRRKQGIPLVCMFVSLGADLSVSLSYTNLSVRFATRAGSEYGAPHHSSPHYDCADTCRCAIDLSLLIMDQNKGVAHNTVSSDQQGNSPECASAVH
jgi:hypothetical protein